MNKEAKFLSRREKQKMIINKRGLSLPRENRETSVLAFDLLSLCEHRLELCRKNERNEATNVRIRSITLKSLPISPTRTKDSLSLFSFLRIDSLLYILASIHSPNNVQEQVQDVQIKTDGSQDPFIRT